MLPVSQYLVRPDTQRDKTHGQIRSVQALLQKPVKGIMRDIGQALLPERIQHIEK